MCVRRSTSIVEREWARRPERPHAPSTTLGIRPATEEECDLSIPDRYIHPVETVSPETSARDAARRMKQARVGALVVVVDDVPSAIVTDRDLALGVLCADLDPEETSSGDLASTPLRSLGLSGSVGDAVQLMRRHLIRRLPVVDDDARLVGIVTADDLIGRFGDELSWIAEATRAGFDHEAALPSTSSGSTFGRE